VKSLKPCFALSFFSALLVSACAQSPSQSSVVKYGAGAGEGSAGAHTVLPGDTLYTVSKKYQLPITEIVTLNNITEPYSLTTGYRLKLPPPNEHVVRIDDTVAGIARTYSVSPSQLVRLNGLSAPYDLRLGQKLRLPTPTYLENPTEYWADKGALKPSRQNARGEPRIENVQPTRSAAVGRVEREVLGASSNNKIETAVLAPPKVSVKPNVKPNLKPGAKPSVQQASTAARAKTIERSLSSVPKNSGNGKFMRPVSGKVISTFGPKKDGLHNDGINIKAARGTAVRAGENGRVVYVGDDLEGYGNLVLIRHENRYMSAYAHLGKMLVKKGDAVKRGQSIGTVGSTGHVDSPQLHFEIRKGTKALNPDKYL